MTRSRRAQAPPAVALPSRPVARIAVGARIFALVAVGAPALWLRDGVSLLGLIAIGGIWALSSAAERRHELLRVVHPIEAAFTGFICGLVLDQSQGIVLALALPPFVAAVAGGLREFLRALGAQTAAVTVTAVLASHTLDTEEILAVFTATAIGLGLGLIGSFVHATSTAPPPDALAPYLDAQRLIRQLLDLSGDLSSGLDVSALAGTVLGEVGDGLPIAAVGLYRPRGEVLVPLASQRLDASVDTTPVEDIVVETWARTEPLLHEGAFAFPVGESAVVGGLLAAESSLDPTAVEQSIVALSERLRDQAVQLDTALLFSDFRDAASADVRSRLAREMHDGVAQDIASLGYLVDALAARPADDRQARALAMLRERITKVVAEVRQSVLTLRTSIGEAESLGAAISTVARHLSESSGIAVSVTVDEHSTRLRPEVETELFRIAQEAMNNAVKHAQCQQIEVHCRVVAPHAVITVRDDGRGLQRGRSDSHGLKIMRERARLVGAELSIADHPAGGLAVTVAIADDVRAAS